MQITKEQIETALICLRNESIKKGCVFNIRFFIKKYQLTQTFSSVLQNMKVYTRTNGWNNDIIINDKLVAEVFNKYNSFEKTYAERERKQKQSKFRNKVGKVLEEYNIKREEIYLSVNKLSRDIPQQILDKGIDVGGGIFLINIIHFEKSGNAKSKLV